MNRDPLVSFNTPFQSGDGLCYPVYPQNYYKTQTTPMYGGRKTKKTQKGGNDYSKPSTVNDYPGDAYLTNLNERYELTGSGVSQPMNSLTESFLNSNMGITYATQAGGRKKKYRGGNLDLESPGAFNQLSSNLGSTQGENSGSLNRAKGQNQKGGNNYQNQNGIVPAEEYYPTKTSILESSASVQGMYPVLSGGKYKKYNKKGGNMTGIDQSATTTLTNMPSSTITPQFDTTFPTNPPKPAMPSSTITPLQDTIPFDIMSGGRYKKYSKKGGNYIFTPGSNFSSQPAEIATQMDLVAQAQHISKSGFARTNISGVDAQMAASGSVISSEMMGGYKRTNRKLKGGVSDFATTLSSRGPINYPDALSAQRFRYFNKTGTFIPNTMLQYAAAPISTGYEADPNAYPMAYNDYIGGAKKKATPAKKKAAPAKKKAAPAKKKAAPAKKKAAPAKKKKSASDKKKK